MNMICDEYYVLCALTLAIVEVYYGPINQDVTFNIGGVPNAN